MSDPTAISQEVHQGNILSPILLNIFINDTGDKRVETMWLFLTLLRFIVCRKFVVVVDNC